MGIFGSRKDKTSNGGKAAAGAPVQQKMAETVAAIAAALELHGAGASAGNIAARRLNYSPWKDSHRARAMERI